MKSNRNLDTIDKILRLGVRRVWPFLLLGVVMVMALALRLVGPTAAPAGPQLPEPSPQPTVEAAVQPTAGPVVSISTRDLISAIQRLGVRPEGEAEVEVFLTTPQFYETTGRALPREALERPSVVFVIAETTHAGSLADDPPAPRVRVDDQELPVPIASRLLASSPHHRTTMLVYPATLPTGEPAFSGETQAIQMVFPAPGGVESASNILTWELPLEYTESYSSREVVLGRLSASKPETTPNSAAQSESALAPDNLGEGGAASVPSGHLPLTWGVLVAIMAGMVVALSPCLIQLVAYYTVVLAGISAEGDNLATSRRHILQTGFFFALGFTLVYTAGGAAAGYIGQSLDTLGLLSVWMRPIEAVAGIIVLFLALRTAWNARAPLVCNLPLASVLGNGHRTGVLSAALMGFSFAGGCLSCFSATVLPALLLYAGSTGSMLYGAVLLLALSLGTSVPVLAIAVGASRFQPLLQRLQRPSPLLGLGSAVVMAGVGFLMLTNQFHLLSDWWVQHLGLY